ncbi:MAG: hypothetical protein SFZ03_05155 [Candidatus Melainabacteria bacterium]|nr:hypothetical protein [Candidatus Melainabacteria bacterium]
MRPAQPLPQRYQLILKQGDLCIELFSDDVYFISRQMDRWCQALLPSPSAFNASHSGETTGESVGSNGSPPPPAAAYQAMFQPTAPVVAAPAPSSPSPPVLSPALQAPAAPVAVQAPPETPAEASLLSNGLAQTALPEAERRDDTQAATTVGTATALPPQQEALAPTAPAAEPAALSVGLSGSLPAVEEATIPAVSPVPEVVTPPSVETSEYPPQQPSQQPVHVQQPPQELMAAPPVTDPFQPGEYPPIAPPTEPPLSVSPVAVPLETAATAVSPSNPLSESVQDDFEAVMDSLLEDLGAAATSPPEETAPESPEPRSQAATVIHSLTHLCEQAQLTQPEDSLLMTVYYLLVVEAEVQCSLARMNALRTQSNLPSVNHGMVELALSKGYLSVVPDLTGLADATEYTLSQEGQQYVESLLP